MAEGRQDMGWRFITPVMLGAVFLPINATILVPALTSIQKSFPDGPAAIPWLIAVLYLAGSVAQPVLGRLADLFGHRRVAMGGFLLVGLSGLSAGLAPTAPALVVSRLFLAIGASTGFPCALGMLRRRANETGIQVPPKALAALNVMANAVGAMGPPLGGFITGWFGWRWVFLINVPLALGALCAGLLLPRDAPVVRKPLREIDIPGIVVFSIFMTSLMVFLMQIARPLGWACGAAAAASLMVLVAVERRHPTPFIDLQLLAQSKVLQMIYLRQTIYWTLLYCLLFGIPLWAQSAMHLSPADSGLIAMPFTVMGALCVAILARPSLNRFTPAFSMLLLAAVSVGILFVDSNVPVFVLAIVMGVYGASGTAATVDNQQSMLRHTPIHQTGAASGLFRTTQFAGAMGSAALVAAVLGPHPDDRGLHILSLCFIPMALATLALTVLEPRGKAAA